jgi:hypothetical protein
MNDNAGELASIVPVKEQPAEPDGVRPGDAVPGGDPGRTS